MTAADLIAYIRACEASTKAGNARRNLPAGTSRARVTSANARWSNAAEHRDRLGADLLPDTRAAIQRELARTE